MRIAIVEDVQADSDLLENLLEQYFSRENINIEISVYRSGEDFLNAWPMEVHMVFLDIQMSGLNGIEVAEKIRKTNESTVIIFLTNNPQFSLAGYSVDALDYLIKPPTQALFNRLLPRAIRRLGDVNHACLTIRNTDGLYIVHFNDLMYIEVIDHKMIFRTKTGEISCKGSLQSLAGQLPRTFFRCHHAFIINLRAVDQMQGPDVIVAGKPIPISKHRRKDFIRALTDCMDEAR